MVITIPSITDSTENLVKQALLQNGISDFKIEY